jgi:DNA-directed RNA polymerase subunit RPC12/RpoP
MDRHSIEGVYGPGIEVDVCFACHVIWLDKRESLLLSPRGTLDLFRLIHEHRDQSRHSLDRRMGCPRCERRLSLNQDIGKAGRFSYYACPAGDGRLTPFSEFLKEKQFVRQLNPAEQARLRAEVREVQCSRCGAPVDIAKGFECGHCGSPLSVLDADAVERTLKELQAADRQRSDADLPDLEARARVTAAMESMRSHPDDYLNGQVLRSTSGGAGLAIDLLSASIGILFRSF